jgi:hypothetical protein
MPCMIYNVQISPAEFSIRLALCNPQGGAVFKKNDLSYNTFNVDVYNDIPYPDI